MAAAPAPFGQTLAPAAGRANTWTGWADPACWKSVGALLGPGYTWLTFNAFSCCGVWAVESCVRAAATWANCPLSPLPRRLVTKPVTMGVAKDVPAHQAHIVSFGSPSGKGPIYRPSTPFSAPASPPSVTKPAFSGRSARLEYEAA